MTLRGLLELPRFTEARMTCWSPWFRWLADGYFSRDADDGRPGVDDRELLLLAQEFQALSAVIATPTRVAKPTIGALAWMYVETLLELLKRLAVIPQTLSWSCGSVGRSGRRDGADDHRGSAEIVGARYVDVNGRRGAKTGKQGLPMAASGTAARVSLVG